MAKPTDSTAPSRGFWIIGGLALLWNLLGVANYLMSVTVSPDTLAAMAEAERALYADIPAWATSAFAIAVFSGSLASLALLLRKAWAVPLFVLSLVGIVVQMGYGLFMSRMLEVQGPAGAALPLLLIVVAVYLVQFSNSAKRRGWIG